MFGFWNWLVSPWIWSSLVSKKTLLQFSGSYVNRYNNVSFHFNQNPNDLNWLNTIPQNVIFDVGNMDIDVNHSNNSTLSWISFWSRWNKCTCAILKRLSVSKRNIFQSLPLKFKFCVPAKAGKWMHRPLSRLNISPVTPIDVMHPLTLFKSTCICLFRP